MLGADFVVYVQELLERLALGRHDKANDVHQQTRHWVSIQHDGQDSLHRLDFRLISAPFQLGLELLKSRLVRRVVLGDQTVGIVQEGRHVVWWAYNRTVLYCLRAVWGYRSPRGVRRRVERWKGTTDSLEARDYIRIVEIASKVAFGET
jgi:hypothetical protein